MAKQRTDTESVLKLVINGEQAKASVKELRETYIKLNTEISNMRKADDPKAYADKAKAVQKLRQAWQDAAKETNNATQQTKGFSKSIKDVAAGMLSAEALTRAWDMAVAGVKKFIAVNAELSDEMARVSKTTGLTTEAVDRLNEKFKKWDTRTAKTELLGLAQVAGKLGISAEKDVEGFVRAADKIGVALGEDLGGTEEAVTSLGKLTDIFKLKDRFGIEDALTRVGSAINTLGQDGTAAEANLVDFAQRLAGIAPAAGISLPNILGLAAAEDELGQSMESSATAIGQFILQLGTDIPRYAKVAGMSVAAFSKLLKSDANEAFIRVLEGSKAADGGVEALAKNMGLLEVSGSKGVAALGALADNTEKLRLRQKISNVEFENGTSILNEFNSMNNTLGANLDKIANRMAALWENSELRGWLTSLTSLIADQRSNLDKLNGEYNNTLAMVRGLEQNTAPLLVQYDQLASKSNLNKDEHKRLSEIIATLSNQYPIAVTQIDAYGKALGINTDIVRADIAEHQRYLKIVNAQAITEANAQKKLKEQQRERLLLQIQEKKANEFFGSGGTGGGGGRLVEINLTNEQLKQKKAELARVDDEIFVLNKNIDTLQGGKKIEEATKTVTTEVAKQVVSLESLKKNLQSLQEERDKVDVGSAKFKELTGDIKKLETQIAKYSGTLTSAQKKENTVTQQRLTDYKKLLTDQAELDAKRIIDAQSKNQQEVANEQAKYDKLIAQWKDFLTEKGVSPEKKAVATAKIDELEVNKKKATDAILERQEKEYLDKIQDLRDSLAARHESELDRERVRINQFYDDLLRDNAGNWTALHKIQGERITELSNAELREKERLEKEKQRLEMDGAAFGQTERQKRLTEINLHYDEEIQALKDKFGEEMEATLEFQEALDVIEANRAKAKKEEEKQYNKERLDAAIQLAEDIANTVFTIGANNRQAENDANLAAIQKARDKELESKNLTESQKKKINDKYDKLEKAEKLRAWKAQKKADLEQAIINTALAVTRALPNFILAGLAAAEGLAQSLIIATRKPPQFARGGLLPDGSSHAQGGIDLIDRRRGRVVGNIEGGEPIISRETYRNNKDIVDALLYSGMRQRGAAIGLNPAAVAAERLMRNGGVAGSASAPVVNVSAPGTDLSALQSLMVQMIEAQREANNKQVVFSNRAYEDFVAKNVAIKQQANA